MKLVLILVCSFLTNKGLSQDSITYYYPDSTISSTGTILNGRPHGIWNNFYPDGSLKSEGKWHRGLLDSTWNFYFHNGDLKLKIQYNKGIKNGYSYTYSFSADSIHFLKNKELFVDGLLEGKTYQYDYQGNITKVVNYKSSLKEGSEIVFARKGVPKAVYVYENNRLLTTETVNQLTNGNKNGTWIKIDDNYNIITKNEYSNDSIIESDNTQDLSQVKYTIEGLENQIRDTAFQGQFINGMPVGRHILYDSLLEPISYIIYDSVGNKIEAGNITNYKLNGIVTGYYIDGNIKYIGEYKNNLKHGFWKYYFQNGNIEQRGNYINDELNGKWIWFYTNSDTLRIETYKYGKRDGLYLSFDPYGIIIQKGYFETDMKQGFWIENTGEFYLNGNYFDGSKNGEWIGIYHNGKKAYLGQYLRGKPDGKHIYQYINGKKRKLEFYETGRKVGHWQYFTKNGQLYKIKSYTKGESIFYKD